MKALIIIAYILLTQHTNCYEVESINSDPKIQYSEIAVLQENVVFLKASISNGFSSAQQIEMCDDKKYICILKIKGQIKNCEMTVDLDKMENLKSKAVKISRKSLANSEEIEVPLIEDLEKECKEFNAKKKTSEESENVKLIRLLKKDKYRHLGLRTVASEFNKSTKEPSFTRQVNQNASLELKLDNTNSVTPLSPTQNLVTTSTEKRQIFSSTFQSSGVSILGSTVHTLTSTNVPLPSTENYITRKSTGLLTPQTELITPLSTKKSNVNASISSTNGMTSTKLSTFQSTEIYAAGKQSTISYFNTPGSYYSTRQNFSNSINSLVNTVIAGSSSSKISKHHFSRNKYLKSKRGKDDLMKRNLEEAMMRNVDVETLKKESKHAKHTTRSDHSRQRRFIYPGTNWCGAGSKSTEEMGGLGVHAELDRCCKEHDKCPAYIESMTYKYSYFNFGLYTISHCECDSSFRTCLRFANTRESNEIGDIFFNKLSMKCFILKPEKSCAERKWNGSCAKYVTKNVAETRKGSPYITA